MGEVIHNLYKCNIETVIKYCSYFTCDIYIQINPKQKIKLVHKGDSFVDSLVRYKEKGLGHVFICQDEYEKFLKYYKKTVERKNIISDSPIYNINEMNISYELIKESAMKIGLNNDHIKIAEEVSKKAMSTLTKNEKLFDLLLYLRKNSNEEFTKNILVGYIATAILGQFDWHTKFLQENVSMAIMLRDIILTPNQLKIMNSDIKPTRISNRVIWEHPTKISKMFAGFPDMVSRDLKTIVKEHHERPDGSGYPEALDYRTIQPISAIVITASYFVDLIHEKNIDGAIIDYFPIQFSKDYDKGNFSGIIKRLISILS